KTGWGMAKLTNPFGSRLQTFLPMQTCMASFTSCLRAMALAGRNSTRFEPDRMALQCKSRLVPPFPGFRRPCLHTRRVVCSQCSRMSIAFGVTRLRPIEGLLRRQVCAMCSRELCWADDLDTRWTSLTSDGRPSEQRLPTHYVTSILERML